MRKKNRRNLFIFAILILIVFAISLVVYSNLNKFDSILEVKSDENLGKKVTVEGKVTMSFKIAQLSGYFLEDATDKIRVSSENLPTEGEIVKIRGILKKDLFGYYVDLS